MRLDDRELQEQVLARLDGKPSVDAARIGVSVSDGVVTLRGTVATVYEKWSAERTARHIFGVRGVADDLDVAPTAARSDPAIAQAAANALEWDSAIPDNAVKVTVRNGWVTLTGTVAWPSQKSAAERIVQHLYGVKGVANSILVQPQASPADVKTNIESAFKQSAEIDAQRVQVEARDGTIILTGTVRSLVEREDAERAAWAAPGVAKVDDRLVVVSKSG